MIYLLILSNAAFNPPSPNDAQKVIGMILKRRRENGRIANNARIFFQYNKMHLRYVDWLCIQCPVNGIVPQSSSNIDVINTEWLFLDSRSTTE